MLLRCTEVVEPESPLQQSISEENAQSGVVVPSGKGRLSDCELRAIRKFGAFVACILVFELAMGMLLSMNHTSFFPWLFDTVLGGTVAFWTEDLNDRSFSGQCIA